MMWPKKRMGQSRPINSEWKTGCITKSKETEELTCYEFAGMERRTGELKTLSINKAKNLSRELVSRNKETITTSTLAEWMVKVGTTSKSDVTQKEKKP